MEGRCRVKFHTMVSQGALTRFFVCSVGKSAEDGNSPDFSALVPASELVEQPCRQQGIPRGKVASRRQEARARSLGNSGLSHYLDEAVAASTSTVGYPPRVLQ